MARFWGYWAKRAETRRTATRTSLMVELNSLCPEDMSTKSPTSAIDSRTRLHSPEVFRLLVDTVADYAIFLLDPDGIITSWNAGAERLKQYKAEEIIGKHFSIFYTAHDLAMDKPATRIARGR